MPGARRRRGRGSGSHRRPAHCLHTDAHAHTHTKENYLNICFKQPVESRLKKCVVKFIRRVFYHCAPVEGTVESKMMNVHFENNQLSQQTNLAPHRRYCCHRDNWPPGRRRGGWPTGRSSPSAASPSPPEPEPIAAHNGFTLSLYLRLSLSLSLSSHFFPATKSSTTSPRPPAARHFPAGRRRHLGNSCSGPHHCDCTCKQEGWKQ